MNWLLDLVEDHRAAVKYDLLAHGYRLEWMGSSRLPWGDALTLLSMQPTAQSAVHRELYPDLFNRSKDTDRLEAVAVLLARLTKLMGNQSGATANDLPSRWEDLFGDGKQPIEYDEDAAVEMRRKLGWE